MSRGSREKLGFISRARGTVVRREGCGRLEGERLRNIGWLVCAGTSLTELPISLRFSSVASSRLLSSRPPRPAPRESLFHSGSPFSSLPSTVPPFSCFLSSLNLPNPLSRSPRYVETEGTVHAIHTCSHVHAAPRFLLVAANTLRQRGRSLLIRGRGGRRDARTAEEIRFYPAAVAETFFPYLGITSKLE